MTTKTRRPSREEVHKSILQTVRDIASADGWTAVTVRKVAERIGYTAPIIYEHFGSKDEMLGALLQESNDILHVSLVEAVKGIEGRDERLSALAHSYWKFAMNAPELYQLMHGMEGAQCADKAAKSYAIPLMAFISEEIIRFNPEHITAENVELHIAEAWSMLHGLIALHMSGYVDRVANAEQVLEMIVSDMTRALARNDTLPSR